MGAILPGLRSMLNYHPLFVHFPIALWVGALLFEILAVRRASEDWHRTAVRALYLGTLLAFAAVGTGWLAEDSVPPQAAVRDVFEFHETMMLITTSAGLALCLWAFLMRNRFTAGSRKLFLIGLMVLVGLLTVGADRGAEMVYRYAVSVNLPTPPK